MSIIKIMDLIIALTLILAAALIGGLVAQKLKQPTVLGYLLAGIVAASLADGSFLKKEILTSLSEIGIAFLMFSLGIEFSFKRLTRVRQVALWGGIIQILLVILFGTLFFPRFGFDFYSSLFLACCFSLSSTAIVTKILFERGEIDSLPGEIMVGWLLVQDLAVLPIILILPKLTLAIGGTWLGIVLAIVKAAIFLFLVSFLGKAVVPKIFDQIAKINSREIMLLAIVGLVLLAALGTFSAGLSFALGAFLAGVILSETTQNHAIFSETRPLRDIFSIVFFVFLGMMLSPSFFLAHITKIVLISAVVILFKLIVVTALVFYLGYHTKTAFIVGMGLIQIGEFSFVLSRLGITEGLINDQVYSYIISVALLTIVLTPFLFSLAPNLYRQIRKRSEKLPRLYNYVFVRFDHRVKPEKLLLKDHVVICGFGRVGSGLGKALQMSQIPYVVVDYDFKVISLLKEEEVPVIYGDPSDIDVLKQAEVGSSKAVVIAIPDWPTRQIVIQNALKINPKVNIICRTHHEEEIPSLKALGVKTVVQPEFEASLSIIHHLLHTFGVSEPVLAERIKKVKAQYLSG